MHCEPSQKLTRRVEDFPANHWLKILRVCELVPLAIPPTMPLGLEIRLGRVSCLPKREPAVTAMIGATRDKGRGSRRNATWLTEQRLEKGEGRGLRCRDDCRNHLDEALSQDELGPARASRAEAPSAKEPAPK